jgi:hypothetical protein
VLPCCYFKLIKRYQWQLINDILAKYHSCSVDIHLNYQLKVAAKIMNFMLHFFVTRIINWS